MTADAASDFAVQRPVVFFDLAAFQKCPHGFLGVVKFFPRHNTLMGVLNGDPVRSADLDRMGAAHTIPDALTENILSDIALIRLKVYPFSDLREQPAARL